MGFPRQGYCSGLPFYYPGDLPNPGVEPKSPAWQAGSLTTEPPEKQPDYTFFNFTNIPLKAITFMYMKVKLLSHVRLFATPWTVAH